LDPFPDHLATLRLGFGWAVFLHHSPSGAVCGLWFAGIAPASRHLSLRLVKNGVQCFGADIAPSLRWRPTLDRLHLIAVGIERRRIAQRYADQLEPLGLDGAGEVGLGFVESHVAFALVGVDAEALRLVLGHRREGIVEAAGIALRAGAPPRVGVPGRDRALMRMRWRIDGDVAVLGDGNEL